MLIVLPPSESKSIGGTGTPVDFSTLSFPPLTETRLDVAEDLVALSADTERAMKALKLSPRLADEIYYNAHIFESPTTSALDRYTGVLYDALQPHELAPSARAQLAIGSALFGVVGGEDMIPHYRLSGSSKLPQRKLMPKCAAPTLKTRWGSSITSVLSEVDFLIDLRSGAYQNLGKVKSATTLRVQTAEGKVVSHFNKHYKGIFARLMASSPVAPTNPVESVDLAQAAGLNVTLEGSTQLVLTV